MHIFRLCDEFSLPCRLTVVNFISLVFKQAWLNEHIPIPNFDGYDVLYTTDNWNRSDGELFI